MYLNKSLDCIMWRDESNIPTEPENRLRYRNDRQLFRRYMYKYQKTRNELFKIVRTSREKFHASYDRSLKRLYENKNHVSDFVDDDTCGLNNARTEAPERKVNFSDNLPSLLLICARSITISLYRYFSPENTFIFLILIS